MAMTVMAMVPTNIATPAHGPAIIPGWSGFGGDGCVSFWSGDEGGRGGGDRGEGGGGGKGDLESFVGDEVPLETLQPHPVTVES